MKYPIKRFLPKMKEPFLFYVFLFAYISMGVFALFCVHQVSELDDLYIFSAIAFGCFLQVVRKIIVRYTNYDIAGYFYETSSISGLFLIGLIMILLLIGKFSLSSELFDPILLGFFLLLILARIRKIWADRRKRTNKIKE